MKIYDEKIEVYIDNLSNSDLAVLSYGRSLQAPILNEPFMKLSYYSLHFVKNGIGFVTFNDKTIEVSANQIFLLPPNINVCHYASSEKPWEIYWVNFSGRLAKNLATRANFTQDNFIYTPKNTNIKKSFLELDSIKDNPTNDLFVTGLLYNILALIIDERGEKDETIKQHLSNHAINAILYIQQHYKNPDLNIDVVANHCCLNASYFSRIFKISTGLGFSNYLTNIRIQAAKTLILQKTPIGETALMVGYNNPLYFSKVFKQMTSISPSQFLEENYQSAN